MKTLHRGGTYYRVSDPTWSDPLDTDFAKQHGGRWNAAGDFGALYLNATIDVAAANARRNFEGEIATLYDLAPEQRPDLQIVSVAEAAFLDVVTPTGVASLRLPRTYPTGATRARCQAIAKRAYADESVAGVACRSNAEATETTFVGEELAVFDRSTGIVRRNVRLRFASWYPTEIVSPPN